MTDRLELAPDPTPALDPEAGHSRATALAPARNTAPEDAWPQAGRRVVLWVPQLYGSAGQVITGGVQTYLRELATLFRTHGLAPEIATPDGAPGKHELDAHLVESLSPRAWRRGVRSAEARSRGWDAPEVLHIAVNANGAPRHLGRHTVGIQHGIYWDRPSQRLARMPRAARGVVDAVRSRRGAACVGRFERLVCVDLAFPTAAACAVSPLPWERIDYVPNFAPDVAGRPAATPSLRRVVFARRLVRHRGTQLFAEAMLPVLRSGWNGEVDIIGEGPERQALMEQFAEFPNVHFDQLPFERRLEAFDEESLVVVPTISTEGTSLTCIEAWSRGALVLATCVGGLANLVLHDTNGLSVRPVADDLHEELSAALSGRRDVARLKAAGHETFRHSFSRSQWAARWKRVLQSLDDVS